MTEKEFNLRNERVTLITLFKTTAMDVDSFTDKIREQDKEFIKLLKEGLNYEDDLDFNSKDILNWIDKLAGEKLSK